jgi:predicted HAD superfamily hydrolase
MLYEKYLPIKEAKIPFDPEYSAKGIIAEHMEGYLHGCYAEYTSNRDIMDDMYHECASILTNYMLEGKLTPRQVIAVRNVLMDMIWNVFRDYINAEDEAEAEKERQSWE